MKDAGCGILGQNMSQYIKVSKGRSEISTKDNRICVRKYNREVGLCLPLLHGPKDIPPLFQMNMKKL
ncbi:MAG: hypothetical protein N2513_04035 [Deltaproteobacteria bacterium]|nr:hypothetical protein [Deltaproteobacteria bacterium]